MTFVNQLYKPQIKILKKIKFLRLLCIFISKIFFIEKFGIFNNVLIQHLVNYETIEINKEKIKLIGGSEKLYLANRTQFFIEKDLTKTLINKGIGCIAFSPLAQGMLSEKYLKGIPKVSRANQKITSLDKKLITSRNITMIKELNIIAKKRGQSLAQMSLAWVLNNKAVTSALIGVRNLKQLNENVASLNNLDFTNNELSLINKKAKDGNINLWLASSSH